MYVLIIEDGGCYICVIENSEGMVVVNFILFLKYFGMLEIKFLKVLNICIVGVVLLE